MKRIVYTSYEENGKEALFSVQANGHDVAKSMDIEVASILAKALLHAWHDDSSLEITIKRDTEEKKTDGND